MRECTHHEPLHSRDLPCGPDDAICGGDHVADPSSFRRAQVRLRDMSIAIRRHGSEVI